MNQELAQQIIQQELAEFGSFESSLQDNSKALVPKEPENIAQIDTQADIEFRRKIVARLGEIAEGQIY